MKKSLLTISLLSSLVLANNVEIKENECINGQAPIQYGTTVMCPELRSKDNVEINKKEVLENKIINFTKILTDQERDILPKYLKKIASLPNTNLCNGIKDMKKISPINERTDSSNRKLSKENEKIYMHNAKIFFCLQGQYFDYLIKEAYKNNGAN